MSAMVMKMIAGHMEHDGSIYKTLIDTEDKIIPWKPALISIEGEFVLHLTENRKSEFLSAA